MSGSIITLIVSGLLLLILMISFGVAGNSSSDSAYHRLNRWLDNGLLRLFGVIKTLRYKFGFYTIRLSLHYVLHNVLKRLRTVLASVVKWVKGLERTNREKAKSFKKAKQEHNNHLNKIAVHKKETSLSDEEKKTLKETKLVG